MKKYMLMTAAVILFAPAMAWSQNAPAGGPPPGGPAMQGQGGGHFAERKAEVLQRMNNHLAEIQKRIACVQAAQNHEQLRACMPERGRGGEGWEHGEGGPMGGGMPPQGGH